MLTKIYMVNKDNKLNINNFRYERKFILDNNLINNLRSLESYLQIELKEQFEERRINSIYYDTHNFILSRQTQDGISERKKVRIRYYGLLNQINNPKLEVKSKLGMMGSKDIYDINKENLISNYFSIHNLELRKNQNNLNYILFKRLYPKLLITYKRQYFLSLCKRYRFTLDNNIMFKIFDFQNLSLNFESQLYYFYPRKILEIKYSKEDDLNASYFTRTLPIRLTSVSKYLIAIKTLGLI